MKHFLPVIALLSCTSLAAQPMLTDTDLTPIFGSSITYHSANYVAPGPATANFTFNAGTLTYLDTTTLEVVQPSATPNGAAFPNATYALAHFDGTFGTYTYMGLDPASLQQVGVEYSGFGTVWSDGIAWLALPCTMGTSWSDTYTGTQLDPGDTEEDSGDLNGQCNGYGTLILPFGTFTNVLRVQVEDSSTTIDPGVDTSTTVSTSVSYYMAGFPMWLFQSVTSTYWSTDQAPTTTQGTAVFDVTSVGIKESKGNGPGALVFPNPASDAFTVSFTAPVQKGATISLIDLVGKEVMKLEPTMAVTNGSTMSFNVSSVPRGMYIVRVMDAQGRSSNMPLVLR